MIDQASNLREQLKLKEASHPGAKVIAIVSGKGGVGKSNFAVNFALALGRYKYKILIFDLDIGMGNIDILLGKQSKYHLGHLLKEGMSISEVIEPGLEELDYVAGGNGLEDFFSLSDSEKDYFFEEFGKVTKLYDFILFDMGAGVTKESLSFVSSANECIIVTTPEPTSLTDAYGMVKHIINKSQRMPINIVMNRSLSSKSGYKALKGLCTVGRKFLNIEMIELGQLPDDKSVQLAVMSQVPYLIYKENAPVSKAVKSIAESYLQNHTYDEPLDLHENSFLERLKKLIMER